MGLSAKGPAQAYGGSGNGGIAARTAQGLHKADSQEIHPMETNRYPVVTRSTESKGIIHIPRPPLTMTMPPHKIRRRGGNRYGMLTNKNSREVVYAE